MFNAHYCQPFLEILPYQFELEFRKPWPWHLTTIIWTINTCNKFSSFILLDNRGPNNNNSGNLFWKIECSYRFSIVFWDHLFYIYLFDVQKTLIWVSWFIQTNHLECTWKFYKINTHIRVSSLALNGIWSPFKWRCFECLKAWKLNKDYLYPKL